MQDREREVMLDFLRVTETAALRAAPWMGKGDKEAADDAAVDGMRGMLDLVRVQGTVIIGEGEKDKAPMLYVGEKVGTGDGPEVDIAVDPLEGTRLVANGLPNAMSVLVAAERGTILGLPAFYMEKIAVGPQAAGHIDIHATVRENLRVVAAVLGRRVNELTVVILDRPRHARLIQEVREVGARIKLISDGDVAAGIATALEGTGVDMLLGIGGAPEGVLTAAALKCLGGELQCRLWFPTPEDEEKAIRAGFTDTKKVYTQDDLIATDRVIFAATGVTDGDLLRGVRYSHRTARTHSILMRGHTKTVRLIETIHHLEHKTLRSRRRNQEIAAAEAEAAS
ncbi:class II fructose-bisphosphatase [Carboxydochorda subterranea]|uniref:Fructose-1,6-bisphosphatase n=1 Tax=Carboxydichorda subterranea TaxID=3109565 RepID=A0ABZ1BUN2_9FIRM|nr:class II fructose-bisphosphatase [Limnochorda sp. L945t]WRP16512.1 class II fructose-bisphosphatase [Limnochorda sp. L945t]